MSCWKLLNFSVFLRGLVAVEQAGDDLGRRGLDLAGVDLAGGAVDRQPVAFLEGLAVDRHRARLVVDLDARRRRRRRPCPSAGRRARRATTRRRAR